jgi:hypothetical protein
MIDRNCLSHWFPALERAGVRVPRTIVVRARHDLTCLLDGVPPEGWADFLAELTAACRTFGFPCFLRTGHGSGKHRWRHSCFVPHEADLPAHVAELVEWSSLVDFLGLPTDVWAVREFLPLRSSFLAFDGTPIAREFRIFIRDHNVQCLHPYWPRGSIENPDRPDWETLLARHHELLLSEEATLTGLALAVAKQLYGHWSVDFAQHEDGRWFAIDVAEGDRSFHWPGCLCNPNPRPTAAEAAFDVGLVGPDLE